MIAAGVPPNQRAYSLLAFAWSKSWRWESNLVPSALRRDVTNLNEKIDVMDDSNTNNADSILIVEKENENDNRVDVMDKIYDTAADLMDRKRKEKN